MKAPKTTDKKQQSQWIMLLVLLLYSISYANPILKSNGLLSYTGDTTTEMVDFSMSDDGTMLTMTIYSDGTEVYTNNYAMNAVLQFRFVNKQHMDMVNLGDGLDFPIEMIHYDERLDRLREMEGMLDLVSYIDVTHRSISSGYWDDPNTWQDGLVPTTGSRVLISKMHTVTVRQKEKDAYKTVRIDGILNFATDVDTEFHVNTMVVDMHGQLVVGTVANPIMADAKAHVVFSKLIDFEVTDSSSPDYDPHRLGLGLISHGTTTIHGAQKTGYATCNGVSSGVSSIVLDKLPSDWRVGDKIVIAGVSYDGLGDEARYIAGIDTGSKRIYLDQSLTKSHELLNHTKEDLQLKLHIINLTRNVVFETSDKFSQRTIKKGIDLVGRAHIMFMHTNNVDIRYAAFNHMGRTDKQNKMAGIIFDEDGAVATPASNPVARYPIHFHRAGHDNPGIIEGCAVEDSPGWGYVNHSSHAYITNSVSYNIRGAGFISEAGDEKGSFINNVAIRSVGNGNDNLTADAGFTSSFNRNINNFGSAGDGFWFHSSDIEVDKNVASGFTGNGMLIWDQGIDGVDHLENGLLTTMKILNTTCYGGYTAFNTAFVEPPIDSNIPPLNWGQKYNTKPRHTIKNLVGWNVDRGIRRKYSKWMNFVDVVFLNDVNQPHGDATSTHSNGRGNQFINPYIEGFVRGFDFEHRVQAAGVYGGYINAAMNCYINIRHSRDQQVIYKDVTFGNLTPEALASIPQDGTYLGFDGNQYNFVGLLAVGGAIDEGFVDPEPQTADAKISEMFIINGETINKAYLEIYQHPDHIQWTSEDDPVEWQNLSNQQLAASDDPAVNAGVISAEYYDPNEVTVPNDPKYIGVVLKGVTESELPYMPIVVDSIQDITLPVGFSKTINLNEVFVNPNVSPISISISEESAPENVSTLISETNTLEVNALQEGHSTITIAAYSASFDETVNTTFTVTVIADAEIPEVMDDTVFTAFNTSKAIAVLDNDSETITGIISVSAPSNGQLSITSDHTLLYVPNTDFVGIDTASYTVTNEFGGENTATATIEVKPLVYDMHLDVLEGTTTAIDMTHTIHSVGTANYGSVNITDASILEYTQNTTNHNGTDTFTYTINGLTATVTLTIIAIETDDLQEVELFGDGFESGDFTTEGWEHIQTTGSQVDVKFHHSHAYSGDYCLHVRRKGKIQKAVSTVGYEAIKVSLARRTTEEWDTYEQGEINYQWTTNGTDWNTIHSDDSFHEHYEVFDFELSESASNQSGFMFGFFADANKSAQRSFIDIVRVTGTPIDPTDTRVPQMQVLDSENGQLALYYAACDDTYKSVTISNVGEKPLEFEDFEFTLNNAFELVNPEIPHAILPGASLELQFKSIMDSAANYGTMSFTTNDTSNPSLFIELFKETAIAIDTNIDADTNATVLSVLALEDMSYQWYQCIDGTTYFPIDGATNTQYEVMTSGDYRVVASNNDCELSTDCVSVVLETLSTETLDEDAFKVYPNPTKGKPQIQSNTITINTIRLYNLQGKQLLYKDDLYKNHIELDITVFETGVYILEITSKDSKIYKKLIKI